MNRLSKFRLEKPIDIRHRHGKLLDLEGWYEADPVLTGEYKELHAKYLESGSKQKIGRWLVSQGLSNTVASEMGKMLAPTRFKLSCRHNDLLRLSETYHYKTCMAKEGFGRQQLRYLGDPDIAIIYVPDAAGKYLWRVLVRLVLVPEYEYGLVAYRSYGNGPEGAIFAELNKQVPVFKAVDIKERSWFRPKDYLWYPSPTVHNNPSITHFVWTDHPLKVIDNRIYIQVRGFACGS